MMKGILQNLYRLQTLDLGSQKIDPAQAAGLRAGIPQGMLTNYDRARARGRKGIAVVRNHVCTNCRMQVPVAVTVSLTAGTIQVCGNCGLYLCLPEPEEQQKQLNAEIMKAAAPVRRKPKRAARQATEVVNKRA